MSARLLAVAALFHITVAVLLFAAGRMQLAPRFADRDGIAPASDSLDYRHDAMKLATVLQRGGFATWRQTAAPLHVRLFSLILTLFAPLAGYGILAAEPLNLLCYLAVVSLTFAIGRETGGARAGLVAAATIALWPTFVFHTTQFLKDPPFIAGVLALVFVVVTWLTRTYDWRHAVAAATVMTGAASLLLLIRSKFAVAILALIVLGAGLLVARQLIEKRLRVWNLACALVALAAAVLAVSHSARTFHKVKAYPSLVRGESKSLAGSRTRVRTAVVRQPAGDQVSQALGSVRGRYIVSDRISDSGIDDGVEIRSATDVIGYLPRAAAIGLWAPFPAMWLQSGQMVGKAGRLLTGLETLVIYILELLTIAAVLLRPRRMPALLLVLFAALGVTLLGLVVTNIGTLYRFRYSFWILLIVTGISGGEKLVRAWRLAGRRRAAMAAVACVCLIGCSGARPVRSDLTITNRTGSDVEALYLSPSDAPAWEENVLGHDVLRDGDTVAIRSNSRAQPPLWDLCVEAGPYRAEWLRLERNRISEIALRFDNGVAVAEVR